MTRSNKTIIRFMAITASLLMTSLLLTSCLDIEEGCPIPSATTMALSSRGISQTEAE